VRYVDHPRSGFAASPSRGQRWRPGEARSAAFAWKVPAVLAVAVLGACSSPRAPAPVATVPSVARPLPPPVASARARNWDEFKVLAGRRLVAANPNGTYLDTPPEPLLAIPVLEIELNGDGSVRRISVQRQPSQALETVQVAIDAVHRGAPYGDISHLPRPWKYSEVFLFRDDGKFKPRALD
jgi:hypothetical protein